MIYSIKNLMQKNNTTLSNLRKTRNKNFKYGVLSIENTSPLVHELLQTEDIFSNNKYLGKLVYKNNLNSVYRIIPYAIKKHTGERIIKNKKLIDELFESSSEKLTLKYTTIENYTEYISIDVEDIFKEICSSNINKCKELVFPKFYLIEDFIPLMNCPNGEYTLVAKK